MTKKNQMPHIASRMQLQFQNMSLRKMLLIALIFLQKEVIAQTLPPPPPSWEYKWESVTKTAIELDIRKFGANPDDEKDDTWAFMKASWYMANLANMDGVFYTGSNPPININYDIAKVKLKIPAGSTPQSRYIVGLQQKFSDQTSNTDLYSFYNSTAPNTLHCGGPFSMELPYKFIFNSVNSSSWTENGTTYYSYPSSTYTKTKTVIMLYELTAAAYGPNPTPFSNWWKNDFEYNSICGTDKIVGATLNITQPNQRRVCSTANLQYQLHDPVTCVQTASLPYTVPLYNMTFPYTVSTEIFKIDNDKNTYTSNPERRPKDICIEGLSNGTIKAKMEYSSAVVGVTDALGNKHDIGDGDQAPLWPNIDACNEQASAFKFILVDGVEIKNFEIDGNVEQHIRKGSYSGDGIQRGATGLELNTTNTTIKDMYVHHMAIDGIAVKNGKCTTEAGIYGNNITVEYNGRVGLAYGSGRKARFDLSKFNHQGSAMSAVQSNTQCYVAFASGVNFEDEGNFCLNGTSTDFNIEDIEFNYCEFNFNASHCVHNDAESQAAVKTRDITFNNCTFHKVKEYTSKTAYGFWIRGENFVFNNCKIWCNVFGTYSYNKPGAETKFIECDFEDKPYYGLSWDPVSQTQTLQNLVWATFTNPPDPPENYLVQNTPAGSYKPLFQKCNFKINDPIIEFMSLAAVVPLTPNSTEAWSEFDNCTFEYKNNGNTIGTDLLTQIDRAKFRNNNKFILNYSNAGTTCGVHRIKMKEVNFEGSNDACNPNTTEFIGMIDNQIENDITVGKKNNSSDDGYAKLEYKNKALLHFPFGTQNLNIGSLSTANIYASAGILTSNIKLNGKGALVVHDGAYLHQNHPSNGMHTITGDANSLLFVSQNINPNGATVHPDYTTSPCVPTGFIGQPWIANNSILGQVCVEGGNSLFVSTANATNCLLEPYSKIFTNGPFNILYNLTNPTGIQFVFKFKLQGGTPTYTCKLNGIAVSPNQNINIDPGVNALLVTDINGCSSDFYFNTDGSLTIGCESKIPANENPSPISNLTSSQLITFNSGTVISYKNYYIDGVFTINDDIKFQHCHFYLTPGSRIQLQPNAELELWHCTLAAACDDMWDGIIADDPSEQLILDGSTLQDMEGGVQLMNNAKADMSSNKFYNNFESVKIIGNTAAINIKLIGNTFKMTDSLLVPHSGEQPLHGIYIDNSKEVTIGDISNASSGNMFIGLWNGVCINMHSWIAGEPPLTTLQTYPNASDIKLYNNTFTDIKQVSLNSNYADEIGSGVYAIREDPFYDLKVTMNKTTTLSNLVPTFNNCEKAVWLKNASGNIQKQHIKEVGIGILATEVGGKKIEVLSNIFNNTYWGVLKLGDEAINGFRVINNEFTLPIGDESTWLSMTPIGIVSAYSSNTHVGSSYIVNNTIDIPKGNTGFGIGISKGLNDVIGNNQIHMTSPNINFDVALPKMVGIFANQSEGLNITGNTIDAGTGNMQFVKTNNAGIRIDACKESRLACNSMNRTKYGIFAVGANGSTTNYDKTVGNYMFNSDANVLLWKLTQEGTLGDVGKIISPTNQFDGDNTFVKPSVINPVLNNVFRITDCPQTLNDKIVTLSSKLTQTMSSASNTNTNVCNVNVINPTTFTQTYICNGVNYQEPIANGNWQTHPMDVQYATHVANLDIDYADYIEGAKRMDEEMVMQWLEDNASARANSPILNAFYLARNATIVGQVNAVDRQISLLNDSTLRSTSEQWMVAYNLAIDMNNALGTTEVFEQNAKSMNKLYLSTLMSGSKVLKPAEEIEIETLAFTCPYTGGNAVFRARVLHGMKHFGIHYDDLEICNGQGIYKGGASKLQEQLNQLSSYNPSSQTATNTMLEDLVYVYPNPATNFITISCTNSKSITIYDVTGKTIFAKELDSEVNKAKIDISIIPSGLYLYKVLNQNNETFNGKLIIE